MDPVNVRRDEISATKQELIRWVEDYLGPVALYTKVNLANKIKLILPDTGQKKILIKIYIICFFWISPSHLFLIAFCCLSIATCT